MVQAQKYLAKACSLEAAAAAHSLQARAVVHAESRAQMEALAQDFAQQAEQQRLDLARVAECQQQQASDYSRAQTGGVDDSYLQMPGLQGAIMRFVREKTRSGNASYDGIHVSVPMDKDSIKPVLQQALHKLLPVPRVVVVEAQPEELRFQAAEAAAEVFRGGKGEA